ncbi:MAG TPA: hypothetical protein PLW81_12485 [Thiobacillaceae bacterium]|nr:hypothetical protein [Thiobacillaceae bacterium]
MLHGGDVGQQAGLVVRPDLHVSRQVAGGNLPGHLAGIGRLATEQFHQHPVEQEIGQQDDEQCGRGDTRAGQQHEVADFELMLLDGLVACMEIIGQLVQLGRDGGHRTVEAVLALHDRVARFPALLP